MTALAVWLVLGGFVLATLAVIWITAGGLVADAQAWRLRRNTRPLRLRITRRIDLSDEAIAITLSPRWGWRRLPSYRPGQHVVLHLTSARQRIVHRAYSLAGWDARPDHYVLGIKREAEGEMSRWLHQYAQPGLELAVGAPKGEFHAACAPADAEIVLIAGGIGITPLRSMLISWRDTKAPPRVTLHFCARTPEQLYFHQDFVALARSAAWFDYRPRLTQPPVGWTGDVGRLTAENVAAGIDSVGRAHVFMCAVPAMEDAIAAGLISTGLDAGHIHRESFGLQAERNAIQANVRFEGRDFAYDGAPTLLHALLAQDFDIPAECRAGECGRCRVSIVCGSARDLLTGKEEKGSVLTCCSVPVSDLELSR